MKLKSITAAGANALHNPVVARNAERALLLTAVAVVATSAAIAGTDTTFDNTVTTITDWTSGSLGKLASIAGVATALLGMVLKFDWKLIGGAAGIGLTAATAPSIVGSLSSAIF